MAEAKARRLTIVVQWLVRHWRGLLPIAVLVLAEEITATADHWRRSYLHTPHGKPVGLRRDLPDVPIPVGHVHHHRHRNSTTPVAVHPGIADPYATAVAMTAIV